MRTLLCSALFTCTLLGFTRGAYAQDSTYVEHRNADGQDIRFIDDPLDAVGRDTIGAQLTVWRNARRFQLVRPRETFVPEMLKNVETL
jgi:hypothetical protein